MTNIIYNEFIKRFFEGVVDMEAPNYFKLALFTKDYTPTTSETHRYGALALTGIECVDGNPLYIDNPNKGYKEGGKYIQFTRVDSSEDGDASYSCGLVHWDNVTLVDDNKAKYAVIYREVDGLLVCCFPFNTPLEIHDEELELSWEDVVTLSIGASASLSIDSELNKASGNAVQNKVITERMEKIYSGIEKFGIRLNDENEDDDEWSDDDNVDTLNKIDDDFIDSLFDLPEENPESPIEPEG